MPDESVTNLLKDMKDHVSPAGASDDTEDTTDPSPPPQDAPEPAPQDPTPTADDPAKVTPFAPLGDEFNSPQDDPVSTPEEPEDDLEAFRTDPATKDIDVDKAPDHIRDNLVNLRKKWKAEEKNVIEANSRVKELESELAQRPAKDTYEKTLEELNATKSRLGLFDVEATEDWKTQVSEPLNVTLNILKDQGSSYGVSPEQVEALIGMEPKQQNDWLKENAEDFTTTFLAHKPAIDRVKYNAKVLKENHPKVLAAHRQKQQELIEQQKASVREQQVAAVDTAITQAATMGIAYLKPVEGDEAHNSMVEETIKVAKGIPDMPPDKILRLAVMGAAAPSYHNMAIKLMKENAELNKQLDKVAGASPRDKGVPGGGAPGGSDKDKPKGPKEWMEQEIANQSQKNS